MKPSLDIIVQNMSRGRAPSKREIAKEIQRLVNDPNEHESISKVNALLWGSIPIYRKLTYFPNIRDQYIAENHDWLGVGFWSLIAADIEDFKAFFLVGGRWEYKAQR